MADWKLYDELIEEIDGSLKVEEALCGHTWTLLRNSAGDVGIAMTTSGDTRPRQSIDYEGMRLRDAAGLAKSWNFAEAGIGMAAINSFYNTTAKMLAMDSRQDDDDYCTCGIDLRGKHVAMVGHMRHSDDNLREAGKLSILEMHTQPGDYPASACEYLVPEADLVVITGSAFVNKTMPRLLELAETARVIITGPTTPMAPVLMKHQNVFRVAGFIPEEKEALWKYVAAGCYGPPYRFGKKFMMEKQH